jgi:hypothetical protein
LLVPMLLPMMLLPAADDAEADARVLCGGGASGEASVPVSLELVDDFEEDF